MINNKKFKFNKSVVGVKGYALYIEYSKLIKNINVNYFLKNYKISNIWWGKWIIRRLISRIFRKRIYTKMNWKNLFWDKIEILLIETVIDKKKYTNADIENKIKIETKVNRFSDIKKYLFDRYGEFILYEPAFSQKTFFLWFAPIILLMMFYGWFKKIGN